MDQDAALAEAYYYEEQLQQQYEEEELDQYQCCIFTNSKKVLDIFLESCRINTVVIDMKGTSVKTVLNFASDLMSFFALLGFCMIFSASFFVAIANFFGWSV